MVRLNLVVFFGTLFISILFSYVNNHSFNLLLWINALFNCSLFITVVGSTMLVIQGGFFNAIIKSFGLFFQKTNHMEQVIEDIEGKRDYLIPYKLTYKLTIPFLVSGSILLLFSIFFSWSFY
ncbi:DUF3899 domain-containing protein [Metabacillus herbersteinensis]|uniref:DUF3899 domain-containing protein n=1 Tax=Metabacillus herbersteinensis TaxID=283816 RepID=A0ABV6GGF5_9BACI